MKRIETFLRSHYPRAELSVQRISGGHNNQAFRVFVDNTPRFLKCYSSNTVDGTERLLNEYRFISYLRDIEVATVPDILAFDLQEGMALFEFVEGAIPSSVSEEDLVAAFSFIESINCHYERDFGRVQFAAASEAVTNPLDFMSIVERRLEKVWALKPRCSEDYECLAFINKEVKPSFEAAKRRLWRKEMSESSGSLCFSPSDFGFHNALKTPKGWVFLDFEYAGVDSTVKLLADFLAQPSLIIPLSAIGLAESHSVLASALRNRQLFPLLLELTVLKWCLILLNVFWNEDAKRKGFALAEDNKSIKAQQLQKAITYFQTMKVRAGEVRNLIE